LNDDAPDRDELRTQALETTVEESLRCGRIIRNMLKFSRQEPTAKWIEDVNDIVRRAAEVTRPYVMKLGGSLEIDIGPVALMANLSPIDIEQVLVNVIRNAAESREGGARVVVSTRRNGDEMSIEVADDGIGVWPADRDHVFEPFFTTRLESGGSGLGLSVAEGVVTDHGGAIEFESQPEKGTRVTVRLPLEISDSQATAGSWDAARRLSQAPGAVRMRSRRAFVAEQFQPFVTTGLQRQSGAPDS